MGQLAVGIFAIGRQIAGLLDGIHTVEQPDHGLLHGIEHRIGLLVAMAALSYKGFQRRLEVVEAIGGVGMLHSRCRHQLTDFVGDHAGDGT